MGISPWVSPSNSGSSNHTSSSVYLNYLNSALPPLLLLPPPHTRQEALLPFCNLWPCLVIETHWTYIPFSSSFSTSPSSLFWWSACNGTQAWVGHSFTWKFQWHSPLFRMKSRILGQTYRLLPSLAFARVPCILSHCARLGGLRFQPCKCSCRFWDPAYSFLPPWLWKVLSSAWNALSNLAKTTHQPSSSLTWSLLVMLSLIVPAHLGIYSLLEGGSHGKPCIIQLETDIIHLCYEEPGLAIVCFHYIM